MFCSNCGKELPDGAKFCSACGAPTGEETAKPPTGSINSSAPNNDNGASISTASVTKTTGNKKILLTIGLIAIAAILIVFGIQFNKKRQVKLASTTASKFMGAIQSGNMDAARSYCSDASALASIPDLPSNMSNFITVINSIVGLDDSDYSDDTKKAMLACKRDAGKLLFMDYTCSEPQMDSNGKGATVNVSAKVMSDPFVVWDVFSNAEDEVNNQTEDMQEKLYNIYYQSGDKTQACKKLLDETLKTLYQSIDRSLQTIINQTDVSSDTDSIELTIYLQKKHGAFKVVSVQAQDLSDAKDEIDSAVNDAVSEIKDDADFDGTILDYMLQLLQQ